MKGPALYAELQRTVEQLGLERDLHRALLGAQSDLGLGVMVSDSKETLYVNDAACHVTGRTEKELRALPSFLELFDGDARQGLEAQLRRSPGSETVELHQESRIRRPDGEMADVEVAAKALRRSDGILVVALLRDISGRKRAEVALRRQTDLYNTLLSAQSDLGDGLAITEGGRFVHVNDALCTMYGYSRQELLAVPNMLELVAPEERAAMTERFGRRLATGAEPTRQETTIVRKDGRRIRIEYSTKIIQRAPDLRLITIIRDVTDRYEMTEERVRRERDAAGQEAAERQRTRTAYLATAGEQLSSSLDLSTRLFEICQLAVPELADWALLETPDDAGGVRPVAVAHADASLVPLLERLTRGAAAAERPDFGAGTVVQSGQPNRLYSAGAVATAVTAEAAATLKDLGLRSAVVVPLRGRRETLASLTLVRGDRAPFDDEELAYALQYAQRAAVALENAQLYEDRRRAEEDLRQYGAIVESSQDAIISFTPDGLVVSWNPAAERIYGYRAEEMVGRRFRQLVPEDRAAEFQPILAAVRSAQIPPVHETVHLTRDGRRIQVSLSLAPLRDADGTLVGVCAMSRDVTDRKLVDEAFQRQRHQLARHLKEVEEVSRVGSALATSDSPDVVHNAAFDALHSLLGVEQAAVVLANADGLLTVAAVRGLAPELEAALPRLDPWAGQASRSFQFYNDLELDHRPVPLRSEGLRGGLNSLCYVPLDFRGTPTGYLVLASSRRGIFSKGDAWLCQNLGKMVAAAQRHHEVPAPSTGGQLLSLLPVGAALVDRDGRVREANPALAALLGVATDALVGRALSSYVPNPEGGHGPSTVTLRDASGAPRLARLTVREVDGGSVWVLEDLAQAGTGAADAELLAALVARPTHTLVEASPDGTILRWGTGAHEAFGFAPREVEGTPYHALFPAKTNGDARALLVRAAASPRAEHAHAVRITKAGERRDVCLHLFGRLGDGRRVLEVGLPGEECPRRRTDRPGLRVPPAGDGAATTAMLRR